MNFQPNQKVTLIIGGTKFVRTVLEVEGDAVYLAEGGDAFDARTGYPWGSQKTTKRLVA